MRSRALISWVTALLVAAPQPAVAFGTFSYAGQNREHEKITRRALAGFGLGTQSVNEIAGSGKTNRRFGTFGGAGIPDNVVRGLFEKLEFHCDGGDTLPLAAFPNYPQDAQSARKKLENCKSVMFSNLNAAVKAADALVDARNRPIEAEIPTHFPCNFLTGDHGRAKCRVFDFLGLAFHAAQDFYSHSNWVDVPVPPPAVINGENPPGLGQRGRAPWLDPRKPNEPFPVGLISDCFDGIREELYCEYDDGKKRVKHMFLNKDLGELDDGNGPPGKGRTLRGRINDNFKHAVNAAIEDTRDKWAYFEEQVLATYGAARGNMINCVMRKDDPAECPVVVARLATYAIAHADPKLLLTSPRLSGDSVIEAQQLLRRHSRQIVVDGVYGRGTVAAVRQFQAAKGLPPDGRIGPLTWAALRS